MSIEILSILLLIGMFVIATIQPINMGALAFGCTFVLGSLIIGMKANDIFAGFPSDLFLTLVAVTSSSPSPRSMARSTGSSNAPCGWCAAMSPGFPG
ncbi:hypothetical protein ABIE78_003335 [Sinorhizobium fredii]